MADTAPAADSSNVTPSPTFTRVARRPVASGGRRSNEVLFGSRTARRWPRFFAEVARVLRPGGHFVYTDLRNREAIPAWEAAIADAPMRLHSDRVVSAEVLRGLEKNSPRSADMIGRTFPAFLRRFGRA